MKQRLRPEGEEREREGPDLCGGGDRSAREPEIQIRGLEEKRQGGWKMSPILFDLNRTKNNKNKCPDNLRETKPAHIQ